MRYEEFRTAIRGYLTSHPHGATWTELRSELGMTYRIPCPTWVARLEDEVGLRRIGGSRGKVWTVRKRRSR